MKAIVNVGLEANTYDLYVSQPIGILGSRASDGKGIGLRNGHFGFYATGDSKNSIKASKLNGSEIFSLNLGNSLPGWWSSYHEPVGDVSLRNWNKRYKVLHIYRCRDIYVYYKESKFHCGIAEYSHLPFFRFEIASGIYLGFRIGINFDELLDFLVGFAGFDPMDDDIIYFQYRELPLPLTEKKDWESKLDTLDEKMDKRLTK